MLPGEAAYNAWRARILNARHLPPWSELPKSAQDGWKEIAQCAIDAEFTERNE